MAEKINIKLNKNYYTKNSIEGALSDFSELCVGKIVSDDFEVELTLKEDLPNLKEEFINYVFALMKNSPEEMESLNIYDKNGFSECKDEEIVNNFTRIKKIDDKFLVVDDFGNWVSLNEHEYDVYRRRNYENEPNLLNKLLDNNIVLNEKNIEDCVEHSKKKKDFLNYGTSLHIVVLTKKCNHNCSYCQTSARMEDDEKYDMDISIAKKVVDRIFESPNNNIVIEFQGGEPLLNFETLKFIVEYANNKNITAKKKIQMSIVTNLTLMDEKKLNFLLSNGVSICTSLDGPEEIHNSCRQDHSIVCKWINKIQQKVDNSEKIHKVNALMTVTKFSLNKHKEIIDEYIKHGFHRIFVRQMSELGHGENQKELQPTPNDFIDFWKKSLDYILELNKKGTFVFEWKTLVILKKLFNRNDPNYAELRSPCGAVTGQLAYNYDGDVYTCDEGRMIDEEVFKLGDVNQSHKTLTTSSCACNIIASSINDTLYCDKCVYKPFCGVCPVLNYATKGSIITNIPSTSWCKIHGAQFDYVFKKIIDGGKEKEILMEWLSKEEECFERLGH